jgi:ribosome maturation factor RimP
MCKYCKIDQAKCHQVCRRGGISRVNQDAEKNPDIKDCKAFSRKMRRKNKKFLDTISAILS